MGKKTHQPAKFKGVLWMVFSGTATLCVFILPAFVILTCTGVSTCDFFNDAGLLHSEGLYQNWPWAEWTRIALIVVILGMAAYHSAYRLIASEKDLRLSIPLFTLIAALIILSILQ